MIHSLRYARRVCFPAVCITKTLFFYRDRAYPTVVSGGRVQDPLGTRSTTVGLRHSYCDKKCVCLPGAAAFFLARGGDDALPRCRCRSRSGLSPSMERSITSFTCLTPNPSSSNSRSSVAGVSEPSPTCCCWWQAQAGRDAALAWSRWRIVPSNWAHRARPCACSSTSLPFRALTSSALSTTYAVWPPDIERDNMMNGRESAGVESRKRNISST